MSNRKYDAPEELGMYQDDDLIAELLNRHRSALFIGVKELDGEHDYFSSMWAGTHAELMGLPAIVSDRIQDHYRQQGRKLDGFNPGEPEGDDE